MRGIEAGMKEGRGRGKGVVRRGDKICGQWCSRGESRRVRR